MGHWRIHLTLATRKRRATVGTAVMAVGPCTVVGVDPWLLTRWEIRHPVPGGMSARVLGALLVGSLPAQRRTAPPRSRLGSGRNGLALSRDTPVEMR